MCIYSINFRPSFYKIVFYQLAVHINLWLPFYIRLNRQDINIYIVNYFYSVIDKWEKCILILQENIFFLLQNHQHALNVRNT
ncbi:hypothetical protein CLU79DRAFT_457150 [Phycomyces nitens]|nr:hypothetical protein CLU79DRAFT_457150 [Phycomyces nitens]